MGIKLNSPTFFVWHEHFVREWTKDCGTEERARSFLNVFLISECLSGVHYSDTQLEETTKKISILMENLPISSEDLPLLEGKISNFNDVLFDIAGTICCITKKEPH